MVERQTFAGTSYNEIKSLDSPIEVAISEAYILALEARDTGMYSVKSNDRSELIKQTSTENFYVCTKNKFFTLFT